MEKKLNKEEARQAERQGIAGHVLIPSLLLAVIGLAITALFI